jgi:heme A synthase
MRSHRDEPELRRPAEALLVLLALQVSLGAITIWSSRAVLPTTAHVAIGAAVLVTSLTLTIRAWRVYGIRGPQKAPHPAPAHDMLADEHRVTA